MKTLVLEFEYMNGPILKDVYDMEKEKMCTDIAVIDECDEIEKLNNEIQDKYNSLYEFDVNENAVVFNEKKAQEYKEVFFNKVKELMILIDKINDGSFIVCDRITDELKKW